MLRQQRSGVVGVDGDERARGGCVVTPNATARNSREDVQKTAERKLAVAAVGSGALSAEIPRRLSTIPSNQRASDSHDDTRLGDVKGIERIASSNVAAFNEAKRSLGLCRLQRGLHCCNTRLKTRYKSMLKQNIGKDL